MMDDRHYMQKALLLAETAAANGEVPVGALLVLPDGREFTGHNAPITLHDPSAHAEMRAMRAACAAVGNYRLNDATLYVTLEPCTMCAGAIVHARIGRVVYGADDPKTGAVTSLYQILADHRLNHQPTVTSGVMADECSALLKNFFRRRRQNRGTVAN
ncbi:tRNA adenosine(34) deaminase TadA [Mariprofundus ferrooxydans]|uniref:tRNA adenosine(34) deaminase TadA n=1 Tax=Mariprofundus ferrooxydans TaxID=314344 RepID=UPI00037AC838|nr:tRNA adenosine(34) deaminase TadA [Mariprofundus ferrooxydans]